MITFAMQIVSVLLFILKHFPLGLLFGSIILVINYF